MTDLELSEANRKILVIMRDLDINAAYWVLAGNIVAKAMANGAKTIDELEDQLAEVNARALSCWKYCQQHGSVSSTH